MIHVLVLLYTRKKSATILIKRLSVLHHFLILNAQRRHRQPLNRISGHLQLEITAGAIKFMQRIACEILYLGSNAYDFVDSDAKKRFVLALTVISAETLLSWH